MENIKINLNITSDQLLDIVKQIPESLRQKLRKELGKPKVIEVVNIKEIKEVLKDCEHDFHQKLGEYTNNQRSADTWADILLFIGKDMSGLFGIKFGCFRNEVENDYTHLGMNFFVIEEGANTKLRQQLLSFFKNNLKNWVQVGHHKYDHIKNSYSNLCTDFIDHETGLRGKAFLKYRSIEKFSDEFEVKEFFEDCINGLVPVLQKIKENPKAMFDDIFRAASPFERILDIGIAKKVE